MHICPAALLLLLPLYIRLTMPSSPPPVPLHHEHPEVPVQQLLVFPSGKDGCALGALGIGSSEMGWSIPLELRTTWIAQKKGHSIFYRPDNPSSTHLNPVPNLRTSGVGWKAGLERNIVFLL